MYYDRLILPLPYQMLNLEKLGYIFADERFIDGNNLKKKYS